MDDIFNMDFYKRVPLPSPQTHRISGMGENNAMLAYAPMIDAKPTDMKTVYNTMKKSKQMTEELGQKTTVQTMDQQLNAIAQQVKWSQNEVFEDSLIRLGGLHTIYSFIYLLNIFIQDTHVQLLHWFTTGSCYIKYIKPFIN